MFQVDNKKKKTERRHWRRFGVFIVNFEHISHHVLVILLLTLAGKCLLGSDCKITRFSSSSYTS